jgi:hypothetical protein
MLIDGYDNKSLLQDHFIFQYLATCSFESFYFIEIVDIKRKTL